MYHTANYYAARNAAIAEVREQMRLEAQAAACKQPKQIGETSQPRSWEAFAECGRVVEVTLSPFFGDQSGSVVPCVYLFSLPVPGWWVGRFVDFAGRVTFVRVCGYSKREDCYNMAVSVEAVL